MRRFLTILLCGAFLFPAAAIEITDDLTIEQESRYRTLAEQLRCLVCQNQSLADSNAGLAADMRAVVRRMIKAGESDAAIITFLTDRYGDFVLYRPPLKPATVLLWIFPFVVLLIGIGVAFTLMRREKRAKLTPADVARAQSLLKEEK